jgi:hypothetical protein
VSAVAGSSPPIPHRSTLIVLGVLGIANLARGGLHVFLPDSGAGTIAGMDLSQGGQAIIFLLAMTGVGQVGAGLVDLAVAFRYRAFAVPLLAIEAVRALLGLVTAWLVKLPPVDVPGKRGMIFTAVLLTAALAWELLRPGRRAAR